MNIVKSALNLFGISKDDEGGSGVVNLDQFLGELPRHLGYDIEFARHQKDDGSHHIEIKGEEAMALLGENTQILDALAHISMRVLRKSEGLANKAVEDGTDLSKYRVTVDAEGFRDRHYDNLKKVAEEAREKVVSNSGRPTYIPALSPSERRVIHTHLATLGEVTSESIGNGTYKRIRVKLIGDTTRRPSNPGPNSPGGNANGNADRPRGPRGPGGGGGRGGDFRRGGRGGGSGGGARQNFSGPPSNQGNRGPRPQREGEVRRARFDEHQNPGEEINGNVIPREPEYTEVDDNIGNRVDTKRGNRYDNE